MPITNINVAATASADRPGKLAPDMMVVAKKMKRIRRWAELTQAKNELGRQSYTRPTKILVNSRPIECCDPRSLLKRLAFIAGSKQASRNSGERWRQRLRVAASRVAHQLVNAWDLQGRTIYSPLGIRNLLVAGNWASE